MIAKAVISDVLLGLAVLIVASASVGVLVMRDAYQKLHFVTPAALVAPALLFMIIAGPFLSHATIRAIRVREKGDWRLDEGGKAPGGEQER
jgi:multisubunit Na+/H+ antiporter MnhG subunit